jgi:hypothetical protein
MKNPLKNALENYEFDPQKIKVVKKPKLIA